MISSMIAFALLMFSAGAGGSQPGPPSSVVVGRLRYVELKGEKEFKSDKAMYVHENIQYVVVDIDRVIVGSEPSGVIIVGVNVDDRRATGVNWIAGDYGVLDPSVWKPAAKIVAFLVLSQRPLNDCNPPHWGASTEEVLQGGSALNSTPYMDGKLQAYHNSPVYCASVHDLLFVQE